MVFGGRGFLHFLQRWNVFRRRILAKSASETEQVDKLFADGAGNVIEGFFQDWTPCAETSKYTEMSEPIATVPSQKISWLQEGKIQKWRSVETRGCWTLWCHGKLSGIDPFQDSHQRQDFKPQTSKTEKRGSSYSKGSSQLWRLFSEMPYIWRTLRSLLFNVEVD